MTWLDKQVAKIMDWWRIRTLKGARPDYAESFTAEDDARRLHRSTRDARRARRDIMTNLLRRNR